MVKKTDTAKYIADKHGISFATAKNIIEDLFDNHLMYPSPYVSMGTQWFCWEDENPFTGEEK